MVAWPWGIVVFASLGVAGYAMFPAFTVAMGIETPSDHWALFVHIAAAIVTLATMAFQFSVRLRQRNPALDRRLGRVSLLGIAFASCATPSAAREGSAAP